MTTKRRHPSSTDVARLAGVSQSAVSRTFNKGKSVSGETSRKVLKAAHDLGYSPNFIPRMLLKHRSELIAIVISDLQNPFYSAALEEFTKSLRETGHQTLVVGLENGHSLDGILPQLASFRVDAIVSALPVLTEAAAEEFARLRMPVVSFNTQVKNRWVSSVCADNFGGGKLVADVFVRKGVRSFGYITGSPGSHASKQRLRGYRSRLRMAGFTDVTVAAGGYTYEGGFNVVTEMLAGGNLPEALFCANDLMALGAIDALKGTRNVRVPEDVMIAGFDDIPAAAWLSYRLTTITQEGGAMVAAAMEVLQSVVSQSGQIGGGRRMVPVKLIERDTTR